MYVSGWVTSTMVVHSTSLKEGLMNTCTHTYIHHIQSSHTGRSGALTLYSFNSAWSLAPKKWVCDTAYGNANAMHSVLHSHRG